MEVKKKLLDVVRDKVRVKHYIIYHNKKHPIEMTKLKIEDFFDTSCSREKSITDYSELSIFCF